MSEHHWQHSEAINEVAEALSLAQADIKGAVKDSSNPFFKSKYADLATVWDACRPQLTTHGLSVAQLPTTTSALDSETGAYLDRLGLTTVLLHRSGQWLSSTMYVQPKDAGAQAAGSALTYMRRYMLSALAGVPQIDDDGEAAEKRPPSTLSQPVRTATPLMPPYSETAPVSHPHIKPAPREPGSDDGPAPIGGGVVVSAVKRASSKPDAQKSWHAGFVTFSDGSEAGSFDAGVIAFLEGAHVTKRPVIYNWEPSKKDPTKRNITAVEYAEDVSF